MNNDKKITIRIPESMHKDVCALALEKGWNTSDVIRAAIAFYFGAKGVSARDNVKGMKEAMQTFEDFYTSILTGRR